MILRSHQLWRAVDVLVFALAVFILLTFLSCFAPVYSQVANPPPVGYHYGFLTASNLVLSVTTNGDLVTAEINGTNLVAGVGGNVQFNAQGALGACTVLTVHASSPADNKQWLHFGLCGSVNPAGFPVIYGTGRRADDHDYMTAWETQVSAEDPAPCNLQIFFHVPAETYKLQHYKGGSGYRPLAILGSAVHVGGASGTSEPGAALSIAENQVILPMLPTSDPQLAGALWNDSGTVKISSGTSPPPSAPPSTIYVSGAGESICDGTYTWDENTTGTGGSPGAYIREGSSILIYRHTGIAQWYMYGAGTEYYRGPNSSSSPCGTWTRAAENIQDPVPTVSTTAP